MSLFLHPWGGHIGVLVDAETDVVNDELKMAKERSYAGCSSVSEDPSKTGAPENIIEKMIIGRLNKELKEICLLDQVYVQDSDLTVAKYVEKVAKRMEQT